MGLKRFGGHPIFNNIANSPSLLTRSKALVRSMKAIYKGTFCSLHFSCSCRTEKIISVVERLDLNPHWDSGYTLSASFCRRGRTTRAKALPATPRREIPLWLLQSDLVPLFLYKVILASHMSCGTMPSLQHLIKMSCKRGNKQDL